MAEFVPTEVWCDRLAEVNGVWTIAEEKHYIPGQCASDWWVFIPPTEYASLVSAYKASLAAGTSSGTGSAAAPVYALSVADGVELSWLIGGAWAVAYAMRLVIAPIKSSLFSPGDDS